MKYCDSHRCKKDSCYNERDNGIDICSYHYNKKYNSSEDKAKKDNKNSGSDSRINRYKTDSDPYNKDKYKSAQEFADDKYEEFYDYEDAEDDGDAWDAAYEYYDE